MIDNKIMREIIEKLYESFSVSISIYDVSGRVIMSTDSSRMSEVNLLATRAPNIDPKVTVSMDNKIQRVGTTMSLRSQENWMGTVVLQGVGSSSSQLAELLSKTIELLYEELILSRKKQNRTQERDQFLYEWLHLQSGCTENFVKREEHLGIDITGNHTIILMECKRDDLFTSTSVIQNLSDDRDVLLPLSQDQNPIILKGNEHFRKKHNRVITTEHNCHTDTCSGDAHLHIAYQIALENLKLSKILFPDEHPHCFEKVELAIVLSRTPISGLEDSFSLLVTKGRSAQLTGTAITYIRLNDDT